MRLDASYSRPFNIEEEAFSWRSDLSASYSPDTVYGSERFGLGGDTSIRGFKDETIAGDQGFFLRNELSWIALQASSWSDAKVGNAVGNTVPYIAYDWGRVNSHSHSDFNHGVLSGATIGLRNEADHFTYHLSYSRALSAPSNLNEKGEEFFFSFGLVF